MGRLTKQDWEQLDIISNRMETNETHKQQYLVNADEPVKAIARKLKTYNNKHDQLTNDEVTEYYILRHAAVHYELMPPLTEDQKVHETDEGQLILAEDFEFNFGQKSLETLKFEGGISFGNY